MGVKDSTRILILAVLNANGKKNEWRFNSKRKMRMNWGPGGGYKETSCFFIVQVERPLGLWSVCQCDELCGLPLPGG